MVLCSFCDGVPLKFKKEKWPGLQFTRTDYLSLVLTPLRIRWTIPLRSTFSPLHLETYARFCHSASSRDEAKYVYEMTVPQWRIYCTVHLGRHEMTVLQLWCYIYMTWFCSSDEAKYIKLLQWWSFMYCIWNDSAPVMKLRKYSNRKVLDRLWGFMSISNLLPTSDRPDSLSEYLQHEYMYILPYSIDWLVYPNQYIHLWQVHSDHRSVYTPKMVCPGLCARLTLICQDLCLQLILVYLGLCTHLGLVSPDLCIKTKTSLPGPVYILLVRLVYLDRIYGWSV
jgi:hypothetical protein